MINSFFLAPPTLPSFFLSNIYKTFVNFLLSQVLIKLLYIDFFSCCFNKLPHTAWLKKYRYLLSLGCRGQESKLVQSNKISIGLYSPDTLLGRILLQFPVLASVVCHVSLTMVLSTSCSYLVALLIFH